MTVQDWDELLKFVKVFTAWPPIVLMIAFLLRSKLKSLNVEWKDIKFALELKQALEKAQRSLAGVDPLLAKKVKAQLVTDAVLKKLDNDDPPLPEDEKAAVSEREEDEPDQGDDVGVNEEDQKDAMTDE